MHSQILPVHAILQLHFEVPSNTACSACSMSSAWDGPLVSLKEVLLILGMYESSVWHRIRYNKYQQRLRTVKQRWGSRKRSWTLTRYIDNIKCRTTGYWYEVVHRGEIWFWKKYWKIETLSKISEISHKIILISLSWHDQSRFPYTIHISHWYDTFITWFSRQYAWDENTFSENINIIFWIMHHNIERHVVYRISLLKH